MTAAAKTGDPAYQAYRILQAGFVAAPILAGLDKFFNLLVNWEKYLAPFVGNLIAPGLFMAVVGVVEIAAGIGVAIKPRIFAYVVAAWLLCIILQLAYTSGLLRRSAARPGPRPRRVGTQPTKSDVRSPLEKELIGAVPLMIKKQLARS